MGEVYRVSKAGISSQTSPEDDAVAVQGEGVAAGWESPRFPPGPQRGVEGVGLFLLGYKLFSNMSITHGSSNNVGKSTL